MEVDYKRIYVAILLYKNQILTINLVAATKIIPLSEVKSSKDLFRIIEYI